MNKASKVLKPLYCVYHNIKPLAYVFKNKCLQQHYHIVKTLL